MNPAENYMLEQQEPFRSIALHLKAVIYAKVPKVTMRYKWRIPFFYAENRPICYMNIPLEKGYVDLAFHNVAHLTKHTALMVSENRKVIKSLRYRTLEGIDDEVLSEVLAEAYALKDRGFYKKD